MSESGAAARYAKSLLELSQEKGVLEEVHQDMLAFSKVVKENRDFAMMLRNPIIKHHKKQAILEAIFKGKVNEMTMSIFSIITKKNREPILAAIAKSFHEQYNAIKGIGAAKVITTVPLDKELKAAFEQLVKDITKKKEVELHEEVDESLIGGFVLKVDDRQIDDSIQTKLKSLRLKFSQNPYIKEF